MSFRTRLTRRRLGASALALAAAGGAAWVGRKTALYAAPPDGEKVCPSLFQPDGAATAVRATVGDEGIRWRQRGGSIDDASCLSRVDVHGIVDVRSPEDVARALAFARRNGLTVSAAGARHSMGGQAFRRGGVVLDMTGLNRIAVDAEARTVTVGAGATWNDVQNVLHPRFAVRAMQSTDIFTVGGSIAVNAHGMDHQAGAMASSIRSMRVMLADGTVADVSRARNRELFDLVVGGYGLFGIVLEAELDVVDNVVYRTGRRLIDYADFPRLFAEEIAPDRRIGLMYAHLSTAPRSFLRELILYTYTEVDAAGAGIGPLADVGQERLRRLTLNLSKRGPLMRELKWLAEKHVEPRLESCTVTRGDGMRSGEACLVSRNDPMSDSVRYLRNALPNDTDILHEYFVPRDRFVPFVDGLRALLERHEANLLNASVRVVHAEANALSYSPRPSFSVVLYVNQTTDGPGNARMARLTSDLIDLTVAEGGRFFLPYQLHYTPAQLAAAYPEIGAFFAAKRRWDPDGLFSNGFYERFGAVA